MAGQKPPGDADQGSQNGVHRVMRGASTAMADDELPVLGAETVETQSVRVGVDLPLEGTLQTPQAGRVEVTFEHAFLDANAIAFENPGSPVAATIVGDIVTGDDKHPVQIR